MKRFIDWFNSGEASSPGRSPFPFQIEAWNAYLRGASGLLHASTGAGKTLAAWGGPVIEWMNGEKGSFRSVPPLTVLWITPLRALANDTVESLREPVQDLGLPWTVEKRTGDTPQSVRQRQRKRLPTALVTTPESLSILLSYPESKELFTTVRAVIVDEWHELMGSKRGVQTELGLARIRRFAPAARTWGLSATIGNTDQAMRVLLGADADAGRLIRGDQPKEIVVETILPAAIDRFPWAGHLGLPLLPDVIDRIEQARSTLVFTNVRSQTEQWFQAILKARPDWLGEIAIHHGSLDLELRGRVESMLRAGALRAVVCTSSLDLGVDFTPVDQVIQIGSPKGVARLMQRAGRSGHQPGAVSRVVGLPTNALELIEYAAAREAVAARSIEDRTPVRRPLDVLVQHLVTIGLGGGFDDQELLEEVRTTHAYSELTEQEWEWAMNFVTGGGPALRSYPEYARIVRSDDEYRVTSRSVAHMHRMSIGTITSDASMTVRYVGGRTLGTIEESFISRLRAGDRFALAGQIVELDRVREMTAFVRRATSRRGVIPRWMGGRSPLSNRLAAAVRRKLDEARTGRFLDPEMQLIQPLLELQARWSRIPAPDELLIERTSHRGTHHAFVFPLAGRLVHEGLGALVTWRLTSSDSTSITVTANDYGFELLSENPLPGDDAEWRRLLSSDRLVEDLVACVNSSQLARRRFRDIARVAGLIFTGYPGQPKKSRHLQASSNLFFDVFSEYDPRNLLLDQARREVLERELEVGRMTRALEELQSQSLLIVGTERFSPLAFPLWAESIRSHEMSSERWIDRVHKMALVLERAASGGRRSRTGKSAREANHLRTSAT